MAAAVKSNPAVRADTAWLYVTEGDIGPVVAGVQGPDRCTV